MKRKMAIVSALILLTALSGCKRSSQYDLAGLQTIYYSDIDTVCEREELIEAGQDFLLSQKDHILLSYVVDSAIELTSNELGDYDHLVLTNPAWVERFGGLDRLSPVSMEDIPGGMREFLNSQMPVLTADGSVLPAGTALYEYTGGVLLAFPVNVTLGAAKPVEAKNPLIVLIHDPSEVLKPASCMLPLTSSGNVLFTDYEDLHATFDNSGLKEYGALQPFNGAGA